jgi:site-specific DNA-cytosine methylase
MRSSDALARTLVNLADTNDTVFTNPCDFFSAGFPCKDFSMLNTTRSQFSISDKLGNSADIFYDCKAYVDIHDPTCGFFENVPCMSSDFNAIRKFIQYAIGPCQF